MNSEQQLAFNKALDSDLWVIKIGSAMLTKGGRAIDEEAIDDWAAQIKQARDCGKKVILVSSGAIAAGIIKLRWEQKPTVLSELQAAAAVGQMTLTHRYETLFAKYGIQTAQVLLTHDDASDRKRYLNVKATLNALLQHDFLPIVNENDTVSFDEIKFGDNDNLGAMVANLVNAGLYIILTDQTGLYDADPRTNANAKLISFATASDESLFGHIGESKSSVGSGGMFTKIQAARTANLSGTSTFITHGRQANCIQQLLNKQNSAYKPATGTFLFADNSLKAKKQWISANLKTKGTIVIDDGAVHAITKLNKSLLAAGAIKICGDFTRGEIISITNSKGKLIAKGISNYSSSESELLLGIHSSNFKSVLGYSLEKHLIHRDNLIVI